MSQKLAKLYFFLNVKSGRAYRLFKNNSSQRYYKIFKSFAPLSKLTKIKVIDVNNQKFLLLVNEEKFQSHAVLLIGTDKANKLFCLIFEARAYNPDIYLKRVEINDIKSSLDFTQILENDEITKSARYWINRELSLSINIVERDTFVNNVVRYIYRRSIHNALPYFYEKDIGKISINNIRDIFNERVDTKRIIENILAVKKVYDYLKKRIEYTYPWINTGTLTDYLFILREMYDKLKKQSPRWLMRYPTALLELSFIKLLERENMAELLRIADAVNKRLEEISKPYTVQFLNHEFTVEGINFYDNMMSKKWLYIDPRLEFNFIDLLRYLEHGVSSDSFILLQDGTVERAPYEASFILIKPQEITIRDIDNDKSFPIKIKMRENEIAIMMFRILNLHPEHLRFINTEASIN